MTNTPITPAMTPEEWAGSFKLSTTVDSYGEQAVWIACDECGETRHALAALCLHNQPFGFDQEDVRSLRDIAAWIEVSFGASKSPVTHPMARDLWNLSDRISALLPPEL